MINIDNLSRHHFSNVLTNTDVTQFADSPDEFVKLINTFPKTGKEQIINANRRNIVPGYSENLKFALNKILG